MTQFPYKAWRILSSSKLIEVEIVCDAGAGWLRARDGGLLKDSRLHASRQDAVAAGIKAVDAEIEKNARQHERLLKKRAALLRAREA